jgi:hypothetical protein
MLNVGHKGMFQYILSTQDEKCFLKRIGLQWAHCQEMHAL